MKRRAGRLPQTGFHRKSCSFISQDLPQSRGTDGTTLESTGASLHKHRCWLLLTCHSGHSERCGSWHARLLRHTVWGGGRREKQDHCMSLFRLPPALFKLLLGRSAATWSHVAQRLAKATFILTGLELTSLLHHCLLRPPHTSPPHCHPLLFKHSDV